MRHSFSAVRGADPAVVTKGPASRRSCSGGRIGAAGLIALVLLACVSHAQTTRDQATAAFRDDVHAAAGVMCTDCHRGSGYASTPRSGIATLCATCHSDAGYMRQFDPQVRVDQYLQYQTSAHGKRMAAAEERVATCTDCHGAHGVKRVSDPRAPVAPLNVTMTCARCHGDPSLMSSFGRDATPPADWASSVHAAALLKRGDASAPTCIACHGSHGATPPGVTSVANVCAQCHAREAELFRAGPKKGIFDAIGEAECLVCHRNHRIEPPEDYWVGVQEGAVCTQCHDESSDSGMVIRNVRNGLDNLQAAIFTAEDLLVRAERAGMLVDDGRLALREARQHQVQSRVLVHMFAEEPFTKTANEGLAAAHRAHEAGDTAMRELQTRRLGLAVATLLVLAFLITLGLKIRQLPPS